MSRNAQSKINNLQTKLEQFTDHKKATKNTNQFEFHFS